MTRLAVRFLAANPNRAVRVWTVVAREVIAAIGAALAATGAVGFGRSWTASGDAVLVRGGFSGWTSAAADGSVRVHSRAVSPIAESAHHAAAGQPANRLEERRRGAKPEGEKGNE